MDISVYVTSDLVSSERRINPNWTLEEFKSKLERITGIEPKDQRLWYYNTPDLSSRREIKISNEAKLDTIGIESMSRIHVENTNKDSELNQLLQDNDDDGEDSHYTIDEQKYNKLDQSVKKWKIENHLGKYDPTFLNKKQQDILNNKKKSENFKIGDRCKINDAIQRLGTVAYLGPIEEIDGGEGVWVGVKLDEPLGKNDGSIKGKQYFSCNNKYGSFVKPMLVEIGDFKQNDDDLFDDDEL